MKLYTASSWRNEKYPNVVKELLRNGHEVYDFRNANSWFRWEEISEDWEYWSNGQFVSALSHPLSKKAFSADFNGMQWADACVLILPCGKSAHIEAGYMKGKGKPLYILLDNWEMTRAELTYSIADGIFGNLPQLVERLQTLEGIAEAQGGARTREAKQ